MNPIQNDLRALQTPMTVPKVSSLKSAGREHKLLTVF